jgi:uncharacterized SAM-binding protein YcdF (DUF218 family)
MQELKEYVQILWDYLAVSDQLQKSDAIFVFGGPILALPEKAAQLYFQGLAPIIIVTGKTGTYDDSGWNRPLATVFTEHLLTLGVPAYVILSEPNSMHTQEDVILGMQLLHDRKGNIQKIIAVSRPLHQRRALATIRKAFPQYHYFSCPCDEIPPSQIDGYQQIRAIAKRALEEIDRIKQYGTKGDLEVQFIPQVIEETYSKAANALRE